MIALRRRDSTAGGAWIEFVDPDGIALRVVHSANGHQHFIGVTSSAEGGWSFYGTPRLRLPEPH